MSLTPMCFIGFVEYLRSTKGGVQLVLNEFMYYKGDAKGTKVSWRCIDYQRAKCKALCQTVDGHVTRLTGTHAHAPHTETIRKRRQRQDPLGPAGPLGPMGWPCGPGPPEPALVAPLQPAQPLAPGMHAMPPQPQPPQPQPPLGHIWHV